MIYFLWLILFIILKYYLYFRLLASVSIPGGNKVISIETLKEKNLAPALENFLFNLSVAEKMIML